MTPVLRTGEALVGAGVVDRPAVEAALGQQAEDRRPIGELIFELTGACRPEIGEAVATHIGFPWVRPELAEVPESVTARVSARLASHYRIFPLAWAEGEGLLIATARPADTVLLDELALVLGEPIRPAFSFPRYIDEAIRQRYGVGAETLERLGSSDASEGPAEGVEGAEEEDGNTASIIRFVNQIIHDAWRMNATDIHFEPGENSFVIRYRVDGLLEELRVPPTLRQYQRAIVSRLKVMARLDIAEQRLPQDGRIQYRIGSEPFDLRVSVLPTLLGEAINLRLLRRGSVMLGLSDLGFDASALDALRRCSANPHGMILATGPTGSGKTTTLYSLLRHVSQRTIKTITVEDPVEYRIPGIIQLQVHEDVGLTFARSLRSILRHDPDVVLVGEIRDGETASIACRMALTGHLVFSTLHTNDAVATVARLLDMGQEPFILASTLTCVLSQRLVRTVCPTCAAPLVPDRSTLTAFGRSEADLAGTHFQQGRGCEACRGFGYRGRTVVHEVLELTDELRSLVLARAPASDFRAWMRRAGVPSMRDHGWQAAAAGRTTLAEVLRVTQNLDH